MACMKGGVLQYIKAYTNSIYVHRKPELLNSLIIMCVRNTLLHNVMQNVKTTGVFDETDRVCVCVCV